MQHHYFILSAGADYIDLTNFLLTFDSTNAIDVAPLVINNDRVAEDIEVLSASLSFPGVPVQRVILAPTTAIAAIHDDDRNIHYASQLLCVCSINLYVCGWGRLCHTRKVSS